MGDSWRGQSDDFFTMKSFDREKKADRGRTRITTCPAGQWSATPVIEWLQHGEPIPTGASPVVDSLGI